MVDISKIPECLILCDQRWDNRISAHIRWDGLLDCLALRAYHFSIHETIDEERHQSEHSYEETETEAPKHCSTSHCSPRERCSVFSAIRTRSSIVSLISFDVDDHRALLRRRWRRGVISWSGWRSVVCIHRVRLVHNKNNYWNEWDR